VPDGRASVGARDAPPEPSFTVAQARRSATFWLLAGGLACVSALGTGLLFHHYDLMASRGIDRSTATTLFAWFAWVIAGTHLATGVLSDRLDPRVPVVTMLVLQAATLVFAGYVTPTTLPVYGVLIGVTQGIMGNVSGTAFARYFGRSSIGGIKGTASTLSVAGAAAGPVLLAWGPDSLGGYGPALWLLAPIPLVLAAACAVALRAPGRPRG
jgi:MFS transporter, OFA family, oxalate/formate antiporter